MGWELSGKGAAAFMWQFLEEGHGVFSMLMGCSNYVAVSGGSTKG